MRRLTVASILIIAVVVTIVLLTQANHESARTDLRRKRELNEAALISESELDLAQRGFRVAESMKAICLRPKLRSLAVEAGMKSTESFGPAPSPFPVTNS